MNDRKYEEELKNNKEYSSVERSKSEKNNEKSSLLNTQISDPI